MQTYSRTKAQVLRRFFDTKGDNLLLLSTSKKIQKKTLKVRQKMLTGKKI